LELFRDIIKLENDFDVKINTDWIAFHEVRSKFVSDKFTSLFGPKRNWEDDITDTHKNIAAGLQDRLEEVVVEMLKTARKKYNFEKLCIAGGVGLNCSLNGRILEEGIFDEIFVQPGSGDNGLSIGACYLSRKKQLGTLHPKKFHNFYLGHRDTDNEILAFLEKTGVKFEKLDGDYSKVCRFLYESKIIGWCQGPAEFGPRALGSRSILAKPAPRDIKDHVNARVKFREPFRPFAPAVLEEKASEWFHIEQQSPHMLMAVQARKEKSKEIEAVIHVDNSARVQTVGDLNPQFKKLIEQFENISGYPILLNTSFNVKGQPIVNDVADAYKCYMSTNLDALVVGDYLLVKETLDNE
jgi:carbamoyltransferase